jgi:hypothetical protein
MSRVIWAAFLLTVAPGLVAAQAAREHRGQGYFFTAPGAVNDEGSIGTLHCGVGGEGLLHRGLGVGGEIGVIGTWSGQGDTMGIASVNSSYHFRGASASRKVVPFVTGGYSLFFRHFSASGANFGGGVNYWFHDRLGLRLEFRDHVVNIDGQRHYVGIRIGLAFR